tara:strand:+ start:231 stop:677 length:447 start_codon:yes stop_codon:yes gene_type:complete
MAETRATRDMETRETEKRSEPWKPAPLLPQPNPREGLDFRYVRASMRGNMDNINVSQALRDGWEPVVSSDYPELKVISDRGSQFPENVLIGGLLLCARPTEIGDEAKRLANEEVEEQVKGVDRSYFREQDSRMPMMSEKNSRVTFGDN